MSWEDQGRQYHMWFGHGTATDKGKKAASGSSVAGQSEADRILALAYGALASLPPAQRRQAETQYDNGTLPRLKEALTAWLRAAALDRASFGSRLFGRGADDPVVRDLRRAALRAATAESHDDLRDAAEGLARAMQGVGIDRWPHFVADAAQRARDPATQAAIEKSKQPPSPDRKAIRPVWQQVRDVVTDPHTALGAASFVPSLPGAVASAADGVLYAVQGKWADAAIALGAAAVGTVSDAGAARLAGKGLKAGAEALGVAGHAGQVAEAGKVATATERAGARFGNATSNDYRATFFAANPSLEGKVVVHHAVEQQVLTRYPGTVTEAEMHSLENLRGIPNGVNSDVHLSQIRREWNQFYRQNSNPTSQQLLDKATDIDSKYGLYFNPQVSGR